MGICRAVVSQLHENPRHENPRHGEAAQTYNGNPVVVDVRLLMQFLLCSLLDDDPISAMPYRERQLAAEAAAEAKATHLVPCVLGAACVCRVRHEQNLDFNRTAANSLNTTRMEAGLVDTTVDEHCTRVS